MVVGSMWIILVAQIIAGIQCLNNHLAFMLPGGMIIEPITASMCMQAIPMSILVLIVACITIIPQVTVQTVFHKK